MEKWYVIFWARMLGVEACALASSGICQEYYMGKKNEALTFVISGSDI